MTNAATNANLVQFLTDRAEFLSKQADVFQRIADEERNSGVTAITANPFVIVDSIAIAALDISDDGKRYQTRSIQAHMCDMLCFDRRRAEHIMSNLDGMGWEIVARRDLAQWCADAYRHNADLIKSELSRI